MTQTIGKEEEGPVSASFVLAGSLTREGIVTDITGSFLESAGADSGDLVGRDLSSVAKVGAASTDPAPLLESFERCLAGETSRTHAIFDLKSEGRVIIEFIFRPPIEPEPDRIRFSGYDVTHWQNEVDECKRLSDLFQAAAESAGIGFWFWYLDSGEVLSTPACNRFFRLPPDADLTEDALLGRVHPEDREFVRQTLETSRSTGGNYDLEFRLVHDDGNVFWIAVRGTTFTGPGAGSGILMGSVQDINELKAVNKELERIYRLETNARDQAELANKTKDYFLALVSHELRSPLNSILGWTKVLLSNEMEEEARLKALKTIERSARAQAKLIEDLVDSASVTSGKLKLDRRRLNVFHVLENVVESYLPSVEQKKIDLKFEYDDEHAFVDGDSSRLRQVFANLLGNAVKFTPKGGEIRCELRAKGDRIEIVFSDTGRGIGAKYLPRIFDRFKQADELPRSKEKGLGLGLAIVKILVEEHRGSIVAKSAGEGKGAEFTVTLPRSGSRSEPVDPAERPAGTAREEVMRTGLLKGIRALVVEDDQDSRKVLEIFLEQLGVAVSAASSVSEAFEKLESEPERLPDIIISDLGMPETDGFEFLERIRRSDRFRSIPAIALSAFSSFEYRERAREAGFQIYHTKPFVPNRLCDEIASLTGRA